MFQSPTVSNCSFCRKTSILMLKVTTGEQWDYVISVNLHPKATELHTCSFSGTEAASMRVPVQKGLT